MENPLVTKISADEMNVANVFLITKKNFHPNSNANKEL